MDQDTEQAYRTYSELQFDQERYPRVKVNPDYVDDLVSALKAGAELPPILVDEDNCVVDGYHRARAYRRHGGSGTQIPVRVVHFDSPTAAYREAVRQNARHGRRMKPKDIVRAVDLGRKHGLTVETLSADLGLTLPAIPW
ncbi:MAG: ParB/RepB/Spo0J family partition protein [Phycisphaerae bacterium]